MLDIDQILEWADIHVRNIHNFIHWDEDIHPSWEMKDPSRKGEMFAAVVAGSDFLERFTGATSPWTRNVQVVVDEANEHGIFASGARKAGDVIKQWATEVRSSAVQPRLVETLGARVVASTDLMEQVHILNADRQVTPAAPIVLAGAALEITLRSVIEELNLDHPAGSNINAYAVTLRKANVLNKQDKKDIDQMAGLRNQAAHGEHDDLSRERAGLMEQQVNLFLRRLEDVIDQSGQVSTRQTDVTNST